MVHSITSVYKGHELSLEDGLSVHEQASCLGEADRVPVRTALQTMELDTEQFHQPVHLRLPRGHRLRALQEESREESESHRLLQTSGGEHSRRTRGQSECGGDWR